MPESNTRLPSLPCYCSSAVYSTPLWPPEIHQERNVHNCRSTASTTYANFLVYAWRLNFRCHPQHPTKFCCCFLSLSFLSTYHLIVMRIWRWKLFLPMSSPLIYLQATTLSFPVTFRLILVCLRCSTLLLPLSLTLFGHQLPTLSNMTSSGVILA